MVARTTELQRMMAGKEGRRKTWDAHAQSCDGAARTLTATPTLASSLVA